MPSLLITPSTLATDTLGRFPAEIITRILDLLDPSIIYFRLFVEPNSSPAQSSSAQCQRVRDICISHNVKFDNMSILTGAISCNDLETVKQVLEEATINAKTSGKKETVVKHATRPLWKKWFSRSVSKNYLDIVREMLLASGMGSYLNEEDRYLDKLLLLAVEKHQGTSLTGLLLQNGADPNITDNGDTPLLLAAKKNNTDAIEMLIVQYQADVNHQGPSANTPLMEAIDNGDLDTVRPFLQSPLLNLNEKNVWEETALHKALLKGKIEIAELLLSWNGVLEECQDYKGRTPLMLCLSNMVTSKDTTRHKSFIEKLLTTEGLDMHASDKENETVLQYAINTRDPKAVQLLLEKREFKITDDDFKLVYSLRNSEIYYMLVKYATDSGQNANHLPPANVKGFLQVK